MKKKTVHEHKITHGYVIFLYIYYRSKAIRNMIVYQMIGWTPQDTGFYWLEDLIRIL